MSAAPEVVIEFYSLARRRAGLSELTVHASTVSEAVAEITRHCPSLRELIGDCPGRGALLFSLNAGPFLSDWNVSLSEGDRLLVITADAGG